MARALMTSIRACALVIPLLALSVPALASPEVVVGAGSTLGAGGQPGGGGATAALGVLWPIDSRFAFGASLFADDLGTGLTALHDPNTGADLGTVAATHRWSFGGEWRGQAELHANHRTRLVWGAGFGYGRQEQDQRGLTRDAVSGVIASTSAAFLVRTAHGHAFGPALAWKREFVHHAADPGRSTTWATAALEWRWQGAANE